MTCASCEILLERKLKKIPGVKSVSVSHSSGKAVLVCRREPSLRELQDAIDGDKYKLLLPGSNAAAEVSVPFKNSRRDYMEIGAILAILFGLYLFFQQTKILDFNLGISENMSYGFIFLVGLVVASSSCLAVTGGVLLSVAAGYNEKYNAHTRLEKFRPHLLFNLGRIVSYTVLGGAIGAIGSAISLTPKITGMITVAAALFMILMGFRILKLFPGLNGFSLRMPKFISHGILNLEGKQSKSIPFTMGALTFFLPCGFTQSLQLYAISRGSFAEGALIMFFFALGTLPALLSLSAISSFAKGGFARLFMKFSGVLVLVLGFYNISNGLALTGNPIGFASIVSTDSSVAAVADSKIEDGKQIVEMDVGGYGYKPDHFTVKQGVPIKWIINGIEIGGCTGVLIVPDYNITKLIKKGENVIEFTPREAGEIPFSCSMAMFRGSFTVLPNENADSKLAASTLPLSAGDLQQQPQISDASETSEPTDVCDPNVSSCNVQRVEMEVSLERGFYPEINTIKKGVPVELIVDNQIGRLGCMSVMTIPEFDVAQLLKKGNNIIKFTPTKTGTIEAVCSMGIHMTTFNVID